jgi:hypothetical protein
VHDALVDEVLAAARLRVQDDVRRVAGPDAGTGQRLEVVGALLADLMSGYSS